MKPLISYYGGKQRIARRIVAEIWQIPHTLYAEPFAGGLAVLFAKGIPPYIDMDSYLEYINDTDSLLINMYRVAREQPEEFIRWFENTPYAQDEYRYSCEILSNPDKYSDIQKAWVYYVNINMSFCNQLGGTFGYSRIDKSAFHFALRVNKARIQIERLNEVGIFNEDAKTFIRRLDCPHALFYCDPPYPEANQGHYCGYSLDDWMELCELLDSIEGSYILSGYEQPIVPKSAQKIIEIPTICSAPNSATMSDGKLQPRLEKLWICDRSSNISEPLKSVAIQHCEKMNPRFGTQQLNILEVVNGHQTH